MWYRTMIFRKKKQKTPDKTDFRLGNTKRLIVFPNPNDIYSDRKKCFLCSHKNPDAVESAGCETKH